MFLLFHIAVPLLICEILIQFKSTKMHRFALIIGALIPDIIDKPLSFFQIGNGRFLGHAPFLYLIAFGLILFTFQKKYIVYSLFFGIAFHLILDIPNIPILWPFISYDFQPHDAYISNWLISLLTDPLIVSTEIIGLFIIILIGMKNHVFFHWENLKLFLFCEMKKS